MYNTYALVVLVTLQDKCRAYITLDDTRCAGVLLVDFNADFWKKEQRCKVHKGYFWEFLSCPHHVFYLLYSQYWLDTNDAWQYYKYDILYWSSLMTLNTS